MDNFPKYLAHIYLWEIDTGYEYDYCNICEDDLEQLKIDCKDYILGLRSGITGDYRIYERKEI